MKGNPLTDVTADVVGKVLVEDGKPVDPAAAELFRRKQAELDRQNALLPKPVTEVVQPTAAPDKIEAPKFGPAQTKAIERGRRFKVGKAKHFTYVKEMNILRAMKPGESVVLKVPDGVDIEKFRSCVQSTAARQAKLRFNTMVDAKANLVRFSRPVGEFKHGSSKKGHGEPPSAPPAPVVSHSHPAPERPTEPKTGPPAPIPEGNGVTMSISGGGLDGLLEDLVRRRERLELELNRISEAVEAVQRTRDLLRKGVD